MRESQTEVPLTIIGAMAEVDGILGPGRQWNPVNKQQELFIKQFFEPYRADVGKIAEIECIASLSSEKVDQFLRERGFGSNTKNLSNGELGIAGIMDCTVKWTRKGSNVIIETPDKKKYKGVRISEGGIWFYRSDDHNHPIVCLRTKTEDKVFMTMLDEEEVEEVPGKYMLYKKVKKIMRDIDYCDDFDGLKFPKVDLDQQAGMDWLFGINTISSRGDPAKIKYIYQRNRLRMNEFGARFQSEVRGVIAYTAVMKERKPDHIIDKPFLCWIQREGLDIPLYVAYVAKEDWKDPGSLGN